MTWLLSGASVLNASAAVTVYTDRAAWEADVGAFVTEDFNAVPLGPLNLGGPYDVGLVAIGVSGTSSVPQANAVVDDRGVLDVDGTPYFRGEVAWRYIGYQDFGEGAWPRIWFPSPVTAFAGDWRGAARGSYVRIEIDDHDVLFSDHLGYPGNGFLGVISSVPFTNVQFFPDRLNPGTTLSNDIFSLDNLNIHVISERVDRNPAPNLTEPPASGTGSIRVFSNHGVVDPQKQTIVLSHGWNSSAEEGEWPFAMAGLLQAQGIDSNVVAWDWHDDANATLSVAMSQASNQGLALADTLGDLLGNDYSQKLHFIGHSLGAIVNRHAVDELHDNGFDWNDTHVTILDAAELDIGPIDLDGQPWAKTIPNEAAWIDNYITTFGSLHSEAANVILREGIPISFDPGLIDFYDGLNVFHSFAHEWYSTSIQRPSDSVMGHNNSFERGTLGAVPVPGPGATFVQTLNPLDDTLALEEISFSEGETILFGRNLIYGGQAGILVWNAINNPIQFAGSVSLDLASEAVHLVMTESSPAYAWIPTTIPRNAPGMSVEFMFENLGENDYLTVGIDDELLFLVSGRDVANGVMVNTGFLDIANWQGQEVELFLALNSDGAAGGRIAIRDIVFHTVVPEPTTVQLFIMCALLSTLHCRYRAQPRLLSRTIVRLVRRAAADSFGLLT